MDTINIKAPVKVLESVQRCSQAVGPVISGLIEPGGQRDGSGSQHQRGDGKLQVQGSMKWLTLRRYQFTKRNETGAQGAAASTIKGNIIAKPPSP